MGSILLESLDLPHCITTYTGRKFRLWKPDPEMIDLRDISAGLSKNCRFSGQIDRFYSVAEHSMNVMDLAFKENEDDPTFQLACLLHDAAEAYIGDIATPFKKMLTAAGFPVDVLESQILDAVWQRFGIDVDPDLWERVMRHDRQALAREVRVLMPAADYLGSPIERLSIPWKEFVDFNRLHFWTPRVARNCFETAAMELLGQIRDSR